MANTFNAASFRNTFATVLAQGLVAADGIAEYVDRTARTLAGCGCDSGEILNLCLDLEDMAKGHFEAQYPRYERYGSEIAEIAYEGAVKRFYCYAHAWAISPARRGGKSLLIVD